MHPVFLFDLDQTLLDFHASERKALEIVAKKYGLNYSEENYLSFKKYNKSLWLELEKQTISRTELFKLRFTEFINSCDGASLGLDPIKINDEFILTMSQNGVLMDGALDFIKQLKAEVAGCRIYIISNGATVNAKGRIKSTGLDEFLDGIFVSESMGVAKPSAEFFDIVLNEIKADTESCIVIGDSLSSDMAGAQNASLSSVWFIPQESAALDIENEIKKYDIDYCADSFDELYDILKEWAENLIMKTQMITRLHHISMKCKDPALFEKAVSFYKEVLGFEEERRWAEGVMLRSGEDSPARLEIFCNGDGIRELGAVRHFALQTKMVDELAAKIEAAGYEVFIKPKDIVIPSNPEFHARMSFFYGPLGEQVELFDPKN